MNIELGKLKEIDIKEIWKHESYDFSAWLSKEENINELGEILGLSLIDIETEVNVGLFKSDIVCIDEITGKRIIIENQLEKSDHDHLGKIITYASGLDASVIVWIVAEAREEHASAIEWLNKHTDKEIAIFLLEIHAYSIGNSKPAPMFKIIEQPNDFNKTMKSISQDKSLNYSQSKRIEFCSQFNDFVIEKGKPFKIRKPTTDHWYDIAIGTSKCHISIELVNKENKIRVGLWISDDKELFDNLIKYREEIESQCNFKLSWDRLDNKKASKIYTEIDGLDFSKQDNYHTLMEKIIENVVILRSALKRYL